MSQRLAPCPTSEVARFQAAGRALRDNSTEWDSVGHAAVSAVTEYAANLKGYTLYASRVGSLNQTKGTE